ncbi:MAG: hypothetical protein FWH18_03210 [Marinilabiliaceae bacterium]|nr:hypothetical protein [Marinilabiliaceae bacterium]
MKKIDRLKEFLEYYFVVGNHRLDSWSSKTKTKAMANFVLTNYFTHYPKID